ncbi:MAG: VOC family protein [Acidobacteriaceae bacterium]|nr:VOC family protein [Acidobacteriaceae bacterium]
MTRSVLNSTLLLALASTPLLAGTAANKAAAEEPFRLSKIGYVMLGVSDMHATVHFYRDLLGLKETRETDDVVFFDGGTISLVASTAIGKQPGDTEVVFSVDHVQSAYEALMRAGVRFERAPHKITESSWAANFRDPDGHILSLFGAK